MTKPRRARLIPGSLAAAIGLTIVVLACWLALSSSALAATGPNNAHDAGHAPAHAARMTHATDEAHLLYIRSRSAGSHLFEEGTAHGTLPGSVIAKCDLGATFVANVTISTRNGIIRGHGTATPQTAATPRLQP